MHNSDKRNSIISFLIKAKRATYAGKGAETVPSRIGSHDLIYEDLNGFREKRPSVIRVW